MSQQLGDEPNDDAKKETLALNKKRRQEACQLENEERKLKKAKVVSDSEPVPQAVVASTDAAVASTDFTPSELVGKAVTHAMNRNGAFPEDPDVNKIQFDENTGEMIMKGKPGTLYHAMVTKQDAGTKRYRLSFFNDDAIVWATLNPDHEGKWWWNGERGTDGKTKASTVATFSAATASPAEGAIEE